MMRSRSDRLIGIYMALTKESASQILDQNHILTDFRLLIEVFYYLTGTKIKLDKTALLRTGLLNFLLLMDTSKSWTFFLSAKSH